MAQDDNRETALGPNLLTISATTVGSLEQMTDRLKNFLIANQSASLSDVAFTLQGGSESYASRRFAVCTDAADAITVLTEKKAKRLPTGELDAEPRPAVFLLPGVGDQYVGMAHHLYETRDVFKQEVDRCAQILELHLGVDIRNILYPASMEWKKVASSKGIDLKRMLGQSAAEPSDPDTIRLNTTIFAQPALFVIEYAMARLWLSIGITPQAMIGHSMGEYVAACIAGVFSLEDALRLIAVRAKLVNDLPQAIMLAVMLSEEELRAIMPAGAFISLINGPSHCVVAGPPAIISDFENTLSAKDVIARRVQNGHAFHTMMMAPVLAPFQEEVRKVQLSPPEIPYISNVTGDWITESQATNPSYWVQHVSRTARFSDALRQLWRLPNPILIECGPGRTLSVLAAQHPDRKSNLQSAIWSIRQRYEADQDEHVFLNALGKVWLAGGRIAWNSARVPGNYRHILLPVYSPETQRGLVENDGPAASQDVLAMHKASGTAPRIGGTDSPGNPRECELVAIWQAALGTRHVGVNDSFGALGGDSLSSIGALMEMRRIGVSDDVARGLYRGLTIRQIAELETSGSVTSNRKSIELSSIDTSVFIRAWAIYIVVAGHFGLSNLIGNRMLMVVSGFSFSKFQLRAIEKEQSIKPVFLFMIRLAIPVLLYVLLHQILHRSFRYQSFLFIDNWLHPGEFFANDSPWFIDLLMQTVLIAALPLSFGAIRRFAIRKAYPYALLFLGISWIVSVIVSMVWGHIYAALPHMYLWFLAIGWCAAYSSNTKERTTTSVVIICLNTISYFFNVGDWISWYAVVASLAIIWFDEIPAQIPRPLVTIINAAAAASLFIYLTHYQFDSLLRLFWRNPPPILSVVSGMLGGYVVWRLWNLGSRITLEWLGKGKDSPISEPSW